MNVEQIAEIRGTTECYQITHTACGKTRVVAEMESREEISKWFYNNLSDDLIEMEEAFANQDHDEMEIQARRDNYLVRIACALPDTKGVTKP